MKRVVLALALALVAAGRADARPALVGPEPPPSREERALWDAWTQTPYHGSPDRLAFGGDLELRFHYDRVFGDADPDWLAVGRISGFASGHISPRLSLTGEAAYDRVTGDLLVERAAIEYRLKRTMRAHAGILDLPLGDANLFHEAPENEMADRSLVATSLLGFPCSQIGIGVRGVTGRPRQSHFFYEADLVTGYGGGIVTDAPDGTRLASGRNTYGDNAGAFALSGRVARYGAAGSRLGVSAQAGYYRMKDPLGVPFGDPRLMSVTAADGTARWAGFDWTGEAGFVFVDVPQGLEGSFAQTQWGGSLTVARVLFDPLIKSWSGSSLSAAARLEVVDFDRAVNGDDRQRVSASLNFRHRPWAVLRTGWYYEVRHDRFANPTPSAGLLLTASSYF